MNDRKELYPDTATFHFINNNPKGIYAADCVIRAISTITGKSWDNVLDQLTEIGKKLGRLSNETQVYNKMLANEGYIKNKQLRKKDGTKYTGKEFCRYLDEHCYGDVIAHIGSHHIVAIMNTSSGHKIYDTWDCSNKCIGNWWSK